MAKKESKEKIERDYNIPLRKNGFRYIARYKKTARAVRAAREFLAKHMKVTEENVKLGMHLNEHLWKHGIKNPPHHVKVHVIKEGDVVKVELEGFVYKEAVKSVQKKKGPETMKDKLEKKLGVKDEPAEKEEKSEKKEQPAEAKPDVKPEEKKAENKKKQ